MGDVVERFYMLAVFVWASLLQATVWAPVSAVPKASKHCFPGLTDFDIMLQLNWANMVQLIFVPVAIKFLSGPAGLQRCVRAGACFATLSALLRVVCTWMPAGFRQTLAARSLLHVAGMCCGASGGFLQGCPSRFSALWFPPEQRARATGCAFVGLGLGQALCYAVSPLLVRNVDELANLMIFQLALAVPPMVCCFAYFPDRPLHAWWLRTSNEVGHATVGTSSERQLLADLPPYEQSAHQLMCAVLRRPSAVVLAVMCGLANGPFQAWGAALPTILGNLHYGSTETDMFSFASLFAYTLGCYIVGELGDRVFRGHFKRLLGLLLLGGLLSFIWLCFMLPTSFQRSPLLDGGFYLVLVAVALTGWFSGATNPICMELCAELTYPTPEGISGNLIIFITQVFTIIVLAVVPLMDPLATTPCMLVVVVLCAVMLLPVREQYLRTEAETCLHDKSDCAPAVGSPLVVSA